MSYSKTLFFEERGGGGGGGGGWRTRKRLKMRTGWAIFMSKLHNNSAPKMILGECWGARVWSLAIPWQACCQLLKTETADNHRFMKWANSLLLPCALELIFAKQKEHWEKYAF